MISRLRSYTSTARPGALAEWLILVLGVVSLGLSVVATAALAV